MRSKRAYLAFGISPSAHQHAEGKNANACYLKPAVSSSLDPTSKHGRDATKAPQHDVDRYADVERKSPVVEHVDAVEHHGYECPFPERDRRLLDVVRPASRKLGWICGESSEKKLKEGNK